MSMVQNKGEKNGWISEENKIKNATESVKT